MSARNLHRKLPRNFESISWQWMRYSGILLIPLVWFHLILQDVLVGVHQIDADYVTIRWGLIFWRGYDMCLLGFALAHGINGLRQVLNDYLHHAIAMRVVNVCLFIFWMTLTFLGATAIVMAGRGLPN